MAGLADHALYQGDDYTALITVRNADGSAADITGYTALAQIRRDVADADATVAATFTAAVSSPHVLLSLTNAQTRALSGKYVWDLQLTSAAGLIATILKGKVSVEAEVSRAASV